jgi:cation diffusion facilitator family transporter
MADPRDPHAPDHGHDHSGDGGHDHAHSPGRVHQHASSGHEHAGGHEHSDHGTQSDGHTHEHGHSHDHGHAHGRGPVAWLRELVVPHSHDASDRVDSALEASREGMRCLGWSFAALTVTAALQAVVVVVSGSVALLGDTLHNFADALTAVPLAIAFTLGRRAANRRYTYGYGRAEDLAGLVVVLLIALSAVAAGWEAVRRLLDPQDVTALPLVALAGLIGFIGNEWVARYRIRVGRRIGSAALVADGLHARTDGFTSLAVLLGAGGVALGFPAADPIVGLLITVAIAAVLRDAAREVCRRLMDAVEPDLVETAEHAVRGTPGVEGVGELRLRWIGHALRAEVEVVVDPALSLVDAHRVSHEAEHRLLHDVPRLAAALVHANPGAGAAAAAHAVVAHHH